ncbi:MAG: hypothetical protein Q9160_003950 [Pyrenula sp. 1 TL-2023]
MTLVCAIPSPPPLNPTVSQSRPFARAAAPPQANAFNTDIDFKQKKINFGNKNPGDVLEQVLRNFCQGNGCPLTGSDMEVTTQVWRNDHASPEEKTLKITAIGDYQKAEADNFIDEIVAAARTAATCEEKTYTLRPSTSSSGVGRMDIDPSPVKLTDTFCEMSNNVKVFRYSSGGDQDKHGSIEVGIEFEQEEEFDWCSVIDFAALLAGDKFATPAGGLSLLCDGIKWAVGKD